MSAREIKLHVEPDRRDRLLDALGRRRMRGIDPVTKPERGAPLRDDPAFRPPTKAGPAPWSAKQARAMDGPTMLRRMVAACLAQIIPNAGEIARGSRDPEHVHQLRVGLRRLRSAVQAMRPFTAGLPAGWEAALRPAFDALGEARDRHVLATSLLPRLRAAGAAVVDAGGPSEAQARRLQRLVRGAALQGLLLRLLAFAEAPGDAADRRKTAGRGRGRKSSVA